MGGLTRPPFVDEILAALPMSDDGTAHVADCGYTHENPKCGCYSLPTRIEAIVRRHVAAALTEAADAIEAKRNEHWQQHLREHPYADGTSCPRDYGQHDAFALAARIVRNRASP